MATNASSGNLSAIFSDDLAQANSGPELSWAESIFPTQESQKVRGSGERERIRAVSWQGDVQITCTKVCHILIWSEEGSTEEAWHEDSNGHGRLTVNHGWLLYTGEHCCILGES